jgi:hypothetical protein
MLATLLQERGDLDGAAEALRSLAAGHEAADDSDGVADVRTYLVMLELRRGRPDDAAGLLERHRDAISTRYGEPKARVLDEAVAAARHLAAGETALGRSGLERVREALRFEEGDLVRWCDLRAWATLALARSLADEDREQADALAAEARAHLTDAEHDPALLAEVDAFLGR